MKPRLLVEYEAQYMRSKPLAPAKVGDTVCVWVKIQEGTEKDGTPKFRLQPFEGVVLRSRKGTTNATFLVRRMAVGGVSVERNFFWHSPLIDRIDIKARGRVRRSRIYYLRNLRGKAARIASRRHVAETEGAEE